MTETTFTPPTRFAVPGRIEVGRQTAAAWQRAVITEIRRETPRASTFRFAVPGWQGHLPGQHLILRLTAEDGYTAQRHYSLASPPDDTGHIELTLDHVDGGEVSGHLHAVARVGDTVEVRGPLSGFFAWPGDRPALLIGAGSGVVPLMSMLRHHRLRRPAVPLRLFVSARTGEELIYADEYGDETTPVLTREGERRRLAADHLAPCFTRGAPAWEAYVCGSNAFAEHASRLLVDLGQPVERIRIERFG
ncbi:MULTISPECIES: ferredoxin reductase [unclassified Streptomyces]|uniref:ferredoxin reductase n=1 Tax=unclassified Streptomyces TaxID=2593676 RepID=UPI000DBA6EB2|nr:ferredoxin reductase [Streptomyces sp. PsTaAH-137]MYT73637.1 oxidoreductase [Streptomyces sp. SID8367]RAJ85175.1 ferredoxin-NADP reductase [Streptomyces sp. PsTaAH-137]